MSEATRTEVHARAPRGAAPGEAPSVVLTAGHTRAAHVEALGELLMREPSRARVAGVLVLSTFRPARVRALVRQRGMAALGRSGLAALRPEAAPGPLGAFLREHDVAPSGLRKWCLERGVPIQLVPDLNGGRAVDFLSRHRPDLVIYGGGGILRGSFLEVAGKVLNAHAGPLPAIRGMNAAEWSCLLGESPEATIHFIDRGIDTGPVLLRIPYARAGCGSLDELRERAVVAGLRGLLRCVEERSWRSEGEPVRPGSEVARQCFVMAPIIRELTEARLRTEARAEGPGVAG